MSGLNGKFGDAVAPSLSWVREGPEDAAAHAQALRIGCPESQSFWQILLTPEEVGPEGKGLSFDEREEEGGSDLELLPQSGEPRPRR